MQTPHLAASALLVVLCCSFPALADPPASPPPTAAPAAPRPAPVEKKHGPRLPGVLVMVLGGAGLGAGAVFGAIATATGASARAQCNGTVCPPSAEPDIAKTKAFQDASYVAFIAGGAVATAGLVITIVAPGDPEKSARLGPWIGPRTGGLGLAVTF